MPWQHLTRVVHSLIALHRTVRRSRPHRMLRRCSWATSAMRVLRATACRLSSSAASPQTATLVARTRLCYAHCWPHVPTRATSHTSDLPDPPEPSSDDLLHFPHLCPEAHINRSLPRAAPLAAVRPSRRRLCIKLFYTIMRALRRGSVRAAERVAVRSNRLDPPQVLGANVCRI